MSFLLKICSLDCFAIVHLAPKETLWGNGGHTGAGDHHGSTPKERTRYHSLEVPALPVAFGPSFPVAPNSLITVLSYLS